MGQESRTDNATDVSVPQVKQMRGCLIATTEIVSNYRADTPGGHQPIHYYYRDSILYQPLNRFRVGSSGHKDSTVHSFVAQNIHILQFFAEVVV
jgi:hypothetical protein